MTLGEWIKEQGVGLGFDRVGIAPATDLPALAFFPEWLEHGYAGALDYMRNPKRRDVRELLPGARSVICCALNYDTAQPRSTEVAPDPERGWVSRYAWGEDYHGVVEEKLEALREALQKKVGDTLACKLYVDTGPVLERVYGQRAGLGWQGKNTCLLDEELGSFFFLGVLVTDLELEPDAPLPDSCGACTLCIDACPTGALVAPYVLDARRCISYLTIELRGPIPEELRGPMGRHVFGCDICQDVCPYNRRARLTETATFEPRQVAISSGEGDTKIEKRKSKLEQPPPGTEHRAPATEPLFHPRLEWLARLSEAEFREAFGPSAVKRAKRRGLARNALVAMGNSGHPGFRPLLAQVAAGDDPLLKEHADWALSRVSLSSGGCE